MDNFSLRVVAEGSDSLRLALQLAFNHGAAGGKVSHWAIIDTKKIHDVCERREPLPAKPWMCLFWHHPEQEWGSPVNAFPVPLDVAGVQPMIEQWLKSAPLPPEPDHDGSNGLGWYLFNCDWGHIPPGCSYGIIGIAPEWAMYGK